MELPQSLVEKKSAGKRPSEQSKTLSAIVVDWLSVYAQVYRETFSEELIQAYVMSLAEGDLRPEILHRAFLRAMNQSTFRPNPGDIHSAVKLELQMIEPRKSDAPEDCLDCRGTSWKLVDYKGGKYAILCEHKKTA